MTSFFSVRLLKFEVLTKTVCALPGDIRARCKEEDEERERWGRQGKMR